MAARLVRFLLVVGILLGATTLQQVVEIQPDQVGDAGLSPLQLDDFTQPSDPVVLHVPARRVVLAQWMTVEPSDRMHTLSVFRPPRRIAPR